MKTLYILALGVSSVCSLFSQTLQPPPLLFNQGGPKAAFTLADRHKFVLGGNWGYESKKMGEALKLNAVHTNKWWSYFASTYADSTDIILFHDDICAKDYGGTQVFTAMAMHFDPTTPVIKDNRFRPRMGDTTGAVFGWETRDTSLTELGTGSDFDRLKILRTNYTTPTDILTDVWPDNALFNFGDNPYSDYNGTRWYLSLNLRLLDSASSAPNDKV